MRSVKIGRSMQKAQHLWHLLQLHMRDTGNVMNDCILWRERKQAHGQLPGSLSFSSINGIDELIK